jgi:hypothetical protein
MTMGWTGRTKLLLHRGLRIMMGSALLSGVVVTNAWGDRVNLSGEYYFYSMDQKDNYPVCNVRWKFNDDDTFGIYSGQEVVVNHFRIEADHTTQSAVATRDNGWLVATQSESNGLPDCAGKIGSLSADGEQRILFYLARNGGITLCWPMVSPGPHGFKYLACRGQLFRSPEDWRSPT